MNILNDDKNNVSTSVDSNKNNKQLQNGKRNFYWIKWIFGGIFLIGSSTGLYFLFKNRNKFLLK